MPAAAGESELTSLSLAAVFITSSVFLLDNREKIFTSSRKQIYASSRFLAERAPMRKRFSVVG